MKLVLRQAEEIVTGILLQTVSNLINTTQILHFVENQTLKIFNCEYHTSKVT